MTKYLLLIFAITKVCEVASLPSHFHTKNVHSVVTHHEIEPSHNSIPQLTRKKKGPTIPYQILVPNLHVIPISHHTHTDTVNNTPGTHNVTQQYIPVLIPIQHYVPVHDLTVIPLHRVTERKSGYEMNQEVNTYRNPLGGYGVGWSFGGHGAGHGYQYTYYI